jgi:hypothetical protein
MVPGVSGDGGGGAKGGDSTAGYFWGEISKLEMK